MTPYIAAWRERRRQEREKQMRELAGNLSSVYADLHKQLEAFLSFLAELDQASSE